MTVVTPVGQTTNVMVPRNSSQSVITLHLATSMRALLAPIIPFAYPKVSDPFDPVWMVVPSMSMRQWIDQELGACDPARTGGITANIKSIFPKDLTVEIEQLALGDEWVDWGVDATALRIMSALGLSSYDEALRRAEAIDEIVRWRPHLLDGPNQAELSREIAEAIEALSITTGGPIAQREQVLERLRAGSVAGLPPHLTIVGMRNLPGGGRFLDMLEALSTTVPIDAFVPVPSIALAERIFGGADGEDEVTEMSWLRDSVESLSLWASRDPAWVVEATAEDAQEPGELHQLQYNIRSGVAESASPDGSIVLVGGFGDSRQAEQVRDAIFASMRDATEPLAPHEVLVVCPDPTKFKSLLERHWSYTPSEGGPRLPNELIEYTPDSLRNRLGASLALLKQIGNYGTREQLAELLSYPSIAKGLDLSVAEQQQLLGRAEEGRLIFGTSPEQRAGFGIYPDHDAGGLAADIGTWQRLADATVATVLYPPTGPEGEEVPPPPVPALGETVDLAPMAKLQPLLRILDSSAALRPVDPGAPREKRKLGQWLEALVGWMGEVSSAPSGKDDSLERTVGRFETLLEGDSVLGELSLTFDQFLELWSSSASSRKVSRVFGRGGVMIAGPDAFPFVPFRVICIIGFDVDTLPQPTIPSEIMALGLPESGRRGPGEPDTRRDILGGLLAAVLSATDRLIVSWTSASEETGGQVDPAIALSELLDTVGTVRGIPGDALSAQAYDDARRHQFYGDHVHDRFDPRLLRLSDPLPALADVAEVDQRSRELTLDDLQQFFRGPVRTYLRHGANVELPEDPDR